MIRFLLLTFIIWTNYAGAEVCTQDQLADLKVRLTNQEKTKFNFYSQNPGAQLPASIDSDLQKLQDAYLQCAKQSDNSAFDHVKYALAYSPDATQKLTGYNSTYRYGNGTRLIANNGARISDIMAPNGDLMVFRYIEGRYVPGQIGNHSKREKVYSCSLDPSIIQQWGGSSPTGVVIVAIPNIFTDSAKFPFKGSDPKCSLDDPCIRRYVNPETHVSDISFYNEISVKMDTQFLISFPKWYILEFLKNNSGSSMTANEIIQKLLSGIEVKSVSSN